MLGCRIFMLALVTAPTPAPTATEKDPGQFAWLRFGESLRAEMPKQVKEGSRLQQANYLAEHTAKKLWALGIPPNYDQAGRKRAQKKFRDGSLGTCGHTAMCLQQVWLGAGFGEKSMKTLIVMKRQPDGQLLQEINADHAAMVYLHPDGPVVFDLWCDGRTQNTFARFQSSVWKGMPVGEWARRMAGEGYTHAGCQEHPELGETPPLQLPELLRKLESKPGVR